MRGYIKQKRNLPFSKFLFVGIPGFEPGKAGPESAVLPLHHTPIKGRLSTRQTAGKQMFMLVGVPGLEPGKAGPESAVLPLHHIPMFIRCVFLNCDAKILLFT